MNEWMFIGDRYCHLSGAYVVEVRAGVFRAAYGFEGFLKGEHANLAEAKKVALAYAESKEHRHAHHQTRS